MVIKRFNRKWACRITYQDNVLLVSSNDFQKFWDLICQFHNSNDMEKKAMINLLNILFPNKIVEL